MVRLLVLLLLGMVVFSQQSVFATASSSQTFISNDGLTCELQRTNFAHNFGKSTSPQNLTLPTLQLFEEKNADGSIEFTKKGLAHAKELLGLDCDVLWCNTKKHRITLKLTNSGKLHLDYLPGGMKPRLALYSCDKNASEVWAKLNNTGGVAEPKIANQNLSDENFVTSISKPMKADAAQILASNDLLRCIRQTWLSDTARYHDGSYQTKWFPKELDINFDGWAQSDGQKSW